MFLIFRLHRPTCFRSAISASSRPFSGNTACARVRRKAARRHGGELATLSLGGKLVSLAQPEPRTASIKNADSARVERETPGYQAAASAVRSATVQ
jgi:hypothetical protein